MMGARSRARKPTPAVATDGGQILGPSPQDASDETPHATGCDNPECEGYKADGRPLLSFPCCDTRQEDRR